MPLALPCMPAPLTVLPVSPCIKLHIHHLIGHNAALQWVLPDHDLVASISTNHWRRNQATNVSFCMSLGCRNPLP